MKRFKKALAFLMAVIMMIGVVNLPAKEVKAAEEVTLSFNRSGIRAEDYIIYLDGLTADQVNAIGSGGLQFNCINIDGKKSTAYGYNVGGEIAIIAPFNQFNGAESKDAVDRHFLTIPKGCTIGANKEYTVAEDITIFINGANNPTAVDNFVSLGYKSTTVRTSPADYLHYLTGPTAEQLNAIGANGMGHAFKSGDILIDGVAKSGPYFWNLSGQLGFATNYSHIKTGATSSADITEDHTITIRKGTKLGTYTVDRDFTLKVNGKNVEWVNQFDAQPTLSIAQNRTDLLMLKADEIETPLTDVYFEAVNSESVYQYNGVDSEIRMYYSKFGGVYAEVAGMSGKSAPDAGDVITIKGLWRYLGDRKVYDFGITHYSWDGEKWIKGLFVDATDATLSITSVNRTDVLIVSVDKLAVPTGDVLFDAVDESSLYLYNGVAAPGKPTMSKYGGIYLETAGMSGGKTTPSVGDTMTISGLWKYQGDGEIYNFGSNVYEWNGSKWQVYVEKTPLTLTWGAVNAAQDKTGNGTMLSRYLMYPTGPSAEQIANLHNKWITIYVDGVAVPNGAQFYNDNGTLLLLLPYSKIEDGATLAEQLQEHDIVIKAGTIIDTYVVESDYSFYVKQYEIGQKAAPSDLEFTLAWGTEAKAQDGNIRYFIYTTGATAEQSAAMHQKHASIYVDGVEVPNGVEFWNDNGTVLLLFQYTYIESGATTAEAMQPHNIQIKAGTVVGDYTLANDFNFYVNKTEIAEGTLPETPQFTLTWGTGAAQDNSEARYLIYPEGATAEQITAFHQKKATIYIDGEPVENGISFWNDGGKLLMYVRYNKFEDGTATSSSQLERHTVVLKAGTEVGGYVLSQDFVFTVEQSSIVGGTQDILFTLRNSGAAQNNLKRFLLYLDGATVAQMTNMHTKKAVFYLDGIQTTGGSHFYKLSDNDFAFLLYYDDIEAGVTQAEELGEHKITLKRGTQIGDYYVGKTITIAINGKSFSATTPESDAELEKMHLKATVGCGYEANGDYTVVATPSTYLPGVIGETVYKITVNVGSTPCEVSATKTDMGELTFTIPANVLTESFTLTIPTADYTSTDGNYGPITLADYALYVNAYGYNEKGYLASKGADVATTPASGSASGIYVSATDSMTVMGESGKPASRVEDGLSGVYYNGELTDVGLRKTAEGTWFVDLAARSIGAVAGDSVILTGSFAKGTEYIDFATVSLTFNGSSWVVNTGVASLPEKAADISEGSFYEVPANTIINGGAVTGMVLSKSGVYTLRTNIAGAICEREVVLYKDGDINADNVMNVLDLIALKKHSLGLKDLNKSGVLANGLLGADTADNVDTLRAKYIVNYTLKADEELPEIVGQTGSGTYITDVQATYDGTAVYSLADTDNGYQVANDTYEGSNLDYVLDFNVNRDLKILQLTDPQLIDSSQMREAGRLGSSEIEKYKPENFEVNAFRYMRGAIEASNPDVIFITGDLIYGEFDDNGTAFLALVEFMESFQIPWAPIFGNHDNESMKGVVWQCEQLMNAEYCLFNRRHDIGGNCNYSVGIAKNGTLERVMYMMDTNACWDAIDRGEPVTDGVGFTEAQLAWYRNLALAVNDFAGEVVPSFLCYHIPTTEVIKGGYVAGYHDILENQTTFSGNYQIGVDNVAQPGDMGRHEERFKDAYNCAGLLDTMLEVGTDGAFFAHSHRNNISVMYGNVRWTFGLKSSEYDRYPTDLGGVLVNLPSDGSQFTVQQIVVE